MAGKWQCDCWWRIWNSRQFKLPPLSQIPMLALGRRSPIETEDGSEICWEVCSMLALTDC